ncbi:hypothetical protein VA7868_00360 [Vibrio aerogenes CECT 7868]|uniref:ABC transporter substrate binding protein n=1 Tax=Vibrio aerogenes CECT 7868 TaxID=1216006 RepID=A0A1M5VE56_9VIBR|nr:ABC transporter substrate binding protein [Vibrio aerogenes]SHH73542.1 hypothetical protein VA7868_00360 [Vibrio aerogenes CECT 7868]
MNNDHIKLISLLLLCLVSGFTPAKATEDIANILSDIRSDAKRQHQQKTPHFCRYLKQVMRSDPEVFEPYSCSGSSFLPGQHNKVVRVKTTPKSDIKLLVLQSKSSSAYDISAQTIIDEYARNGIRAEFIILNYQGSETTALAAIKLAETKQFNQIFAMGSAATRLLTKNYQYGSIPVITVCSKNPVAMGLIPSARKVSGNHIAYTSLNIDISTQIEYLKQKFLPRLRRIAVIYHGKNSSSIQTQVLPLQHYLAVTDTGISLELIEVNLHHLAYSLYQPMLEFSAQSAHTDDSIFLLTGSTELFMMIDQINAHAGDIPVLSVTPSHVVAGPDSVFMSIGVSFKNNALLASQYSLHLIQGLVQPDELPVGIVKTPDIAINFMRKPQTGLKVPFHFFEDAIKIYDYQGHPVFKEGSHEFNKK